MSIDESTVKHIAHLSRLALTDAEVARYTQQLGAILDYASHLPALTDHPAMAPLRTEADVARPTADPHGLLRNAVEVQGGYVKVPAILARSEGDNDA